MRSFLFIFTVFSERKMSWGAKFVQKLKAIGYPNADKLNGSDVDWFFEKEELAPFLEWFTECIDASNVLTQKELAEYNKIEQSEVILDGDVLVKALNNLPQPTKEETAENKLEEKVREMRGELATAHLRLKINQKQNYKLNQLYAALNEQSNELTLNIEKLNATVKEKWNDCMEAGKQFDNILNEVQSSNKHLHSLYSGFFMEPSSKNTLFLSQLDLSEFQLQEEKHNLLLKSFIKKQFFDGFEKVSGDTWNEMNYKLRIKKPNLQLVQEDSQNDYMYHCLALKRLSDFYPHIKFAEIDLQAEECQLLACIDRVKKINQTVENGKFPCDSNAISRLQKELNSQTVPLKGKLDGLRFKTIVNQVHELADSQSIKTVTGDYALKSVRQQYINSKLDKVLTYLIRQRARCEIFSLLYELELESHRETHEVVLTVDKMVEEEQTNLDHTLRTLQQLTAANTNFEIQSQEDACAATCSLLVSKKQPSKNLPFALLDAAKSLQTRLVEVEAALKQMTKHQEQRTRSLDHTEQHLENIAFSDQPVNKLLGHVPVRPLVPILGLPNVEEAVKLLRNKVGELETKVFANINEHNVKLKILKNNDLLHTERQIFHIFYNDPKKLEKISSDLELFSMQPTLLKKESSN